MGKTYFSNFSASSIIACLVFSFDGEEISLTISDYDLHPLPKETQTSYNETCSQISVCKRTKTHRIFVGTSFSGIVTEDTISGSLSGEFSGFCVFKKYNKKLDSANISRFPKNAHKSPVPVFQLFVFSFPLSTFNLKDVNSLCVEVE